MPWTVACHAPLSMEFSKQESWSGFSFPSPRDLPNPGIEPGSPAWQANSLPFEPPYGAKLETTEEYPPQAHPSYQFLACPSRDRLCMCKHKGCFLFLFFKCTIFHCEEDMASTPVFLPGESHGQRSLVGYTAHGAAKSSLNTNELTEHRRSISLRECTSIY